jgi:hypothetical protein
MPWTLSGEAVVVVAQQFNPTVVSQLWLVRNGFLREEEFQPGCIFTDLFVQVISNRFNLLITPEQLQFVPRVSPPEQQNLIIETVGAIVRKLPHTPYRAVGLNFAWHAVPAGGNTATFTRRLFFRPESAIYRAFDVPDAQFGAYLSKDALGFRLKFEVKPVTVPMDGSLESRVHSAFNFNADLGENAAESVERYLLCWNDVKREAEQIVNCIALGE